MSKYFFIVTIMTAFAFYFMFPIGFKFNLIDCINKIILKEELSEWIIKLTVYILLKVISLTIIITILLPLLKDFPFMKKKQFVEVKGKVTQKINSSFGRGFFRQTITINDKDIKFYLCEPIIKGESYTVYYLPNSKFGVDIKLAQNN